MVKEFQPSSFTCNTAGDDSEVLSDIHLPVPTLHQASVTLTRAVRCTGTKSVIHPPRQSSTLAFRSPPSPHPHPVSPSPLGAVPQMGRSCSSGVHYSWPPGVATTEREGRTWQASGRQLTAQLAAPSWSRRGQRSSGGGGGGLSDRYGNLRQASAPEVRLPWRQRPQYSWIWVMNVSQSSNAAP